jgi:hypothetical protein
MTSFQPAIEIHDISNPAAPAAVGELAIPTRPGLGTESHDISFNDEGTRAYSAALSQGVVIDTEDPAHPKVISSFVDPTINVWHQLEPIRFYDGNGNVKREFLIAEDEFAGAVGTGQCPNGGVHVYDVTGDREANPVKVGYWNIDDTGPTRDAVDGRCTAHVFQIHEREQLMTLAWYNGGVRVVDLSGLSGISLGTQQIQGSGMRELGFYRWSNADTWSAKTPRIDRRTGDFYLYGNDVTRGMDVYRFEGAGQKSAKTGQWMTPAQAQAKLGARPALTATSGYRLACLLAE